MKTKRMETSSALTAFLLVWPLLLGPGVGFAQETPNLRLETAPEGYIMVSVEVLPQFVDEPSRNFHRARENFLKRDYKQAAEPVRKSAAIMQLEAARATGEPKKTLLASIDELNKLADRINKGEVKSAKSLDDAFARAHYALANHHLAKARELWAKNRPKRAGEDIKAAAIHLQDGWAWTGKEMPSDTLNSIKEGRALGTSLVEGKKKETDEVIRLLDKLGNDIKKLGGNFVSG